jgi:hypothetical protein
MAVLSYKNIDRTVNVRFTEPTSVDTFDIYVQGVFSKDFEGPLSFTLGDTSAKISGVIKLSQIFLITLLTSRGSDIFDRNRGTDFSDLIGGNFSDLDEISLVIKTSVREATRQIQEIQTQFLPVNTDEILRSAEVQRIDTLADSVFPYVLISSAAGSQTQVKLPVAKVFSR